MTSVKTLGKKSEKYDKIPDYEKKRTSVFSTSLDGIAQIKKLN
jgi:hypothetical protein